MILATNGPWAAVVRADPQEFAALRAWLAELAVGCDRPLLVGPRFPAGLASYVQAAWGSERVQVMEQGTVPEPASHWETTAVAQKLRSYQREAVIALLDARRGIVDLPPGSGKTLVAVAAATALPARWLFLVTRSSLVHQALRVFGEYGFAAASPEGGRLPDATITVGTPQAVQACLDRDAAALHPFHGLIVDEVHGAGAPGFSRLLEATAGASVRIGFSATALLREDLRNPLTAGLIGPVVYRRSAVDLVADGFLCPGLVRFLPFRFEHDRRGEWHEVYRDLITGNDARNDLIARATLAAVPPRVVIVREIEHGVRLQNRLGGLEAPLVQGSDPPQVRDKIFDLVRAGRLDTIIVTAVGEVGVDLPNVPTVVNAAAGKSAITAIQRLGRGTRRPDGKFGFELLDVQDAGHGWFEEHARARAAAYADTGYLIDGDVAPPAGELDVAPEVALLERGPVLPKPVAAVAPGRTVWRLLFPGTVNTWAWWGWYLLICLHLQKAASQEGTSWGQMAFNWLFLGVIWLVLPWAFRVLWRMAFMAVQEGVEAARAPPRAPRHRHPAAETRIHLRLDKDDRDI